MPNAVRSLFARKSIEALQADADASTMRRSLTARDVVLIGVGEIIGAGIFVITGKAAAEHAGPAIVLSFVIAGIACAFAGLCYSEMASMIPVSGSAYTYTYTTIGELMAWIIGWDLMLEYLMGAATVAVGWSAYLYGFFKTCGWTPDKNWFNGPIAWTEKDGFVTSGELVGYINLPAIVVVAACTVVLVIGIKQSAMLNHAAVVLKLIVVLLFLFATFGKIHPENWRPFLVAYDHAPDAKYTYGFQGVLRAATMVFFAYIGFDAVSTCAQETKRPSRDMPIGILGSLAICTVLYILVSLNLTGIRHYSDMIGSKAPLADAVQQLGMHWLSILISLGAVAGLTSVILVSLLGQPRVFHAMAYDGLLPPTFAQIHPRYGTPWIPTITSGVFCAVASAFLPLDLLGDMTSAGTLFAFALVSVSVGVLRYTRPDIERKFRVPGGPILVPFLGFAFSVTLIVTTGAMTVLRLIVWMALGLVVYACYGFRHSHIRRGTGHNLAASTSTTGPMMMGHGDGEKGSQA
ncbi:hypothetical protein RI367_007267 [Sorochytrium milnesiophthora]